MKKTLMALLLFGSSFAMAHEVPDDVTMRVFLKPSQDRMQILVRIPVNALIDTLFPTLPNSNFLDLKETNQQTAGAARLWVADLLNIYEGDTRLARPQVLKTVLSRLCGMSFANYPEALAHINGAPLPDSALLTWDRSFMDVLLETAIHSDRSDFSIVPRFGRLGVRVTNIVGFMPARGGQRNFEYEGDPERYLLDPAGPQAAAHFFNVGFSHILAETDHLLLLFCLVLLFHKRLHSLIPFALTFTAAHSISLIASALIPGPGPAWMPRVAGTLMALAIIYTGLDCIIPATPERFRTLVALCSGLVFGSGFWFYLYPVIQFGGEHRVISALSYNAGIEAGQCLAFALLIPAASLFFHFAHSQKLWTMVFAGLAAHLAWHHMTERAFTLSSVPLEWPSAEVWTAILIAGAIGAMTVLRGKKEVTQ